MKRCLLLVLTAVLVALGLLSSSTGSASATEPKIPPLIKTFAKSLHCKPTETYSLTADDGGKGVELDCTVKNSHGRQEFEIIKYKDWKHGLDYWRELSAGDPDDGYSPGYFATKSKIIIFPHGGDTTMGHRDGGYSLKWANYGANHAGGRVVEGYPY
jgi:hypothetical protein